MRLIYFEPFTSFSGIYFDKPDKRGDFDTYDTYEFSHVRFLKWNKKKTALIWERYIQFIISMKHETVFVIFGLKLLIKKQTSIVDTLKNTIDA